ncbi:MAG: hypothetical protein GY754_42255 [bacterium]|nr:hypothetical protein [bacterium]
MKKSMSTVIVLAAFLFTAGYANNATAQDVAGGSLFYSYSPYTGGTESFGGSNSIQQDTEFRPHMVDAKAAVPIIFNNNKTVFVNYLEYRFFLPQLKNMSSSQPGGITKPGYLHDLSYTLLLRQEFTKDWCFITAFTPGVATDFKDSILDRGFLITSSIGLEKKFSKNFIFSFGFIYGPGSKIPVLPYIGFEWTINSGIDFNVFLPYEIELLFDISSAAEIGIFGEIEENTFTLNKGSYGVDDPLLYYARGAAGARFNIHFHEWVHLTMEAGYSLFQYYEVKNNDNKIYSFTIKEAWTVKAGVALGV